MLQGDEGGSLVFALVDDQGTQHQFHCSFELSSQIAWELALSAVHGGGIAAGQPFGFKPASGWTFPFVTHSTTTMGLLSKDRPPHVVVAFHTPQRVSYSTKLGPQAAYQLYRSLDESLSTLPMPPISEEGGSIKVPGPGHKGGGHLVTYFGQNYRADILQTLGVLMIRANVLDHSLIKLLAILTRIDHGTAEAMFHALRNTSARLEMIQATVPFAGLDELVVKAVRRALAEAASASAERNTIVHGNWEFYKDRFKVSAYTKPGARSRARGVSANSLLKIAKAYRDAALSLESAIQGIEIHRGLLPTSPGRSLRRPPLRRPAG